MTSGNRWKINSSRVLTVFTGICIASCGGSQHDQASTSVRGTLSQWEVHVDSNVAKAGEVTFIITNEGTIRHEFLIVKTDIVPGEIPIDIDHFPESTDGIQVVGKIGRFAAGATETLTVNLSTGSYQLVCNLPKHYGAGMSTSFEVIS